MKQHKISVILTEDDFEISMCRKPYGQDEFDEWASILECELRTGYVNWNFLDECVVEERG